MNEPCLCGALDCRACRGADAQIAHQNGDEAKARQCLRELIATLEPFAEA